ncbi:MAG: hypothetical protein WDN25_30410 [Acetobacteraceae bacterium]
MKRALLLLWAFICLAPAAKADIWISSADPYSQPKNPMTPEFMAAFRDGANWSGKGIQAFKFSTQFLYRAPEGDLSEAIRILREKHIAIAMEGLLLVESERCGRGVESYSWKGAIPAVAERVKRLGGEIAFVALDEPVTWGHYSTRARTCRDPVSSLADQMAANVKVLKAAFPNIKFGSIEPITPVTADRLDALFEFFKEFKRASGEPISFLHADISWAGPWHQQLAQWKTRLHASGMRLGVIANGDPQDTSNAAWTGHAIERYRAVVNDPAVRPDDVIFQSWMSFPTKLVPDTEPGTLTNLAREASGR